MIILNTLESFSTSELLIQVFVYIACILSLHLYVIQYIPLFLCWEIFCKF